MAMTRSNVDKFYNSACYSVEKPFYGFPLDGQINTSNFLDDCSEVNRRILHIISDGDGGYRNILDYKPPIRDEDMRALHDALMSEHPIVGVNNSDGELALDNIASRYEQYGAERDEYISSLVEQVEQVNNNKDSAPVQEPVQEPNTPDNNK